MNKTLYTGISNIYKNIRYHHYIRVYISLSLMPLVTAMKYKCNWDRSCLPVLYGVTTPEYAVFSHNELKYYYEGTRICGYRLNV